MPRVSPSAAPRKREKVPNVTMSGGKSSRAIITALSAPPSSPSTSVSATASGSGTPASRQSAPSTTAASPIIEPTERSMPPVMMIGVIASASSPISTARRVISNAFEAPRKLCPVRPNTAHSAASTTSSTHSPFGKSRSRSGASVLSAGASETDDMSLQPVDHDVRDERREDDPPLDRLLPERVDAEERERGADGAKKNAAEQGAGGRAAPAGDGRAADDHRR